MCSWVISSSPYSFSLLKRKKRTRTRTTCQVVQAVTPLTRCLGSLSGRGWKRYTAQPWNLYPERVYQNYQGYDWIWIQGWKHMWWSLVCDEVLSVKAKSNRIRYKIDYLNLESSGSCMKICGLKYWGTIVQESVTSYCLLCFSAWDYWLQHKPGVKEAEVLGSRTQNGWFASSVSRSSS